jgi:hypothetical protein
LPAAQVVRPFKLTPNYSHGKQIKLPGYSIFETWERCAAQIKDDSLVN